MKLVYLISRVFLVWTFLNFLAYCAISRNFCYKNKLFYYNYYPEEDEDLEQSEKVDNIQQENDGSSLDHQAIVKICDLNIPFNIKGNNVYLYKRAMMELFKIRKGRCANFIKMDSILNEAGITKNEAFILHHGRLRKYISIPAIKVLMTKEFLVCKNPALKPEIGMNVVLCIQLLLSVFF